MANIRTFKALRPDDLLADKVAALPYDVYNRAEARDEALKQPLSFINIERPETQFEEGHDMYTPEVYEKAKEMLLEQIDRGIYKQDEKACYYIYELTMDQRAQTGIVAVAAVNDYVSGVIKKHENTRADKEQDRINHVDTLSAQTGPIFLAYRKNDVISAVVSKIKATTPVVSFVSSDGIGHRVWIISDDSDISAVNNAFSGISEIYIADGHHRAASAVKVGLKRRQQEQEEKGSYDPDAEYNFFLSVLFPENELMILPYNRVVKDLNGMTEDEFVDRISGKFEVESVGITPVTPGKKGQFGMFLGDKWYSLKARPEILDDSDPVKSLDVSVLQDNVLKPMLGIDDPKTDKRIDFVGGIRGLEELERRVHTDMKVAFSMYPTSIGELFDVASAGLLMPPKSTWFEPKLRSGLFIHRF
ncbi:MAG: DUF1015 domain-containing protein [Lachnospiraceae bacterium]|nr:DUF1015 domain-containing protein [Lachnospiraceae bacterium]